MKSLVTLISLTFVIPTLQSNVDCNSISIDFAQPEAYVAFPRLRAVLKLNTLPQKQKIASYFF